MLPQTNGETNKLTFNKQCAAAGGYKKMKNKERKLHPRVAAEGHGLIDAVRYGDGLTKLSLLSPGIAIAARGQVIKGILHLLLQAVFLFYLAQSGFNSLVGLTTLGTQQQEKVFNENIGIYEFIKGDNSMLMLLGGVAAVFIIFVYLFFWRSGVIAAYEAQIIKESKKKLPTFIEDVRSLFDKKLYKTLLFLPIVGLLICTIIPLVYMILMAFTNYDVNHQPPGNLFSWVGLENFKILLNSQGKLSQTFWPVLGWTMIWAIMATFTNYLLGIFLAMLINSKRIRAKKLWRTIFVISIAVPAFVSLLIVRVMLQPHGALNILLQELGFTSGSLPFLSNATWARVTVIIVNLWIGIPHTMLIATGILPNISQEQIESARIDGANKFQIFVKITMPYILFITTPYLITNFIYNINNFNAIYFLTDGGPATLEYFKGAGKTDLLVTWLFKLTTDSKDYCYAAAIGILIFIISAVFSLLVYRRSGAYKDEEAYS